MNEYVKSLVRYCPDTGHIIRMSDGKVLGWPDKNGYIELRVKGRTYKAHRLAFYLMGEEVPDIVDHPNGVPWDNRWANLKPSSRSSNMRNCKKRADNKSGVTGVTWAEKSQKWLVHISGKHVGTFTSFDEAVSERKKAEQEHGYSERHGT